MLLRVPEIVSRLAREEVQSCLVGEIALCYYNVPRVLNDIELCVNDEDLCRAETIIAALPGLTIAAKTAIDIYNEHKEHASRFICEGTTTLKLVLLPASAYGLPRLSSAIVPTNKHSADAFYSKEILDDFDRDTVKVLPFPMLATILQGVCIRYTETWQAAFAMAAEQLVDGTNVDEEWCRKTKISLSGNHGDMLQRLMKHKDHRLSFFTGNQITCYLSSLGEADQVRNIPGFSDPLAGNVKVHETSDHGPDDILGRGHDQAELHRTAHTAASVFRPQEQPDPGISYSSASSPASMGSL